MRSSVPASIVTLAAVAWIMCIGAYGATHDAQTADEAVYITAGLSYWRTGDFRLNTEHPPLVKLLIAAPLAVRGIEFTPDPVLWHHAAQWDIAPSVLYQNTVQGLALLADARAVNVVLLIALVLLGAWWAFRTWGMGAGYATLVLLAFEPNLLAHGHLATTDIGYSLFLLLSVVMFGRYLERPTNVRMVIAAITFSLALVTRFNALLLLLLLPVQYLIVQWSTGGRFRLGLRRGAVTCALFLGSAIVITWASYGFEIRTLSTIREGALAPIVHMAGSFGAAVGAIAIPAPSYVQGFLWQLMHNERGVPAYLFGSVSETGWWYYYPVAFMVKLTVGFLVLACISAAVRIRRFTFVRSESVFNGWFLLAPFVLVGMSLMLSNIDIGVRYALPLVVLIGIVAGGALHRPSGRLRYIGIALIIAHAASSLSAAPHFLPYANEAFGGSSRTDRYLIDSNVDWGQDVPLVARYLEEHGIDRYCVQPFSNVPPEVYGFASYGVPDDGNVDEGKRCGVIVIGRTALRYPGASYEWLRNLTPTAVLGNSINVYDLRGEGAVR